MTNESLIEPTNHTTTLTDTLNEARREMTDKQNTDLLPELLSCPFCGCGDEHLIVADPAGNPAHESWVLCDVCKASSGIAATINRAREKWNTRNTASGGMAGDASTRKDEGGALDIPAVLTSPASIDEMREAFEREARKQRWDIYGYGINGHYHDPATARAYIAFQVAYNIIPSAALDDIRAAREGMQKALMERGNIRDEKVFLGSLPIIKPLSEALQRLEKYGDGK